MQMPCTDDLVKARSLCGVFFAVEPDTEDSSKLIVAGTFSGMLEPGQRFDQTDYIVHTCVHGFVKGNAKDNVAYYFVPYGVSMKRDSNHGDFISKAGFKVTQIKIGTNTTFKTIDDEYFEKSNIQNVNLYNQNDYAVVKIKKINGRRRTLKHSLMNARIDKVKLNIVQSTHDCLPKLNELTNSERITDMDHVSSFNSSDNERLFAIGYACDEFALDSSGIAVSTSSVVNEKINDRPRRSLNNDERDKIPPDIGQKEYEYSCSSLLIYNGMSGGPVLRCKMNPKDPTKKACVLIGTLWGSERVFINDRKKGEQIKQYGCFINKKTSN